MSWAKKRARYPYRPRSVHDQVTDALIGCTVAVLLAIFVVIISLYVGKGCGL